MESKDESQVTPHLTTLHKELTFWCLLVISLPGIANAYLLAVKAISTGTFNEQEFLMTVLATPLAWYLGLARQWPRATAVAQSGVASAPAQPVRSGVDPNAMAKAQQVIEMMKQAQAARALRERGAQAGPQPLVADPATHQLEQDLAPVSNPPAGEPGEPVPVPGYEGLDEEDGA